MNTAAQKRSRIFGTVRDDRGDPIELANVRIQAQGVRTVTNLKGEYSLYCSSRAILRTDHVRGSHRQGTRRANRNYTKNQTYGQQTDAIDHR